MIPIELRVLKVVRYYVSEGVQQGDDGSVFLHDYLMSNTGDYSPLFRKMDWTLIGGWGRYLNLIERFAEL